MKLWHALVVIVVIVVGATGWYVHYHRGLRPRLVVTLPVHECKGLLFGPFGDAYPPGTIDEICRQHGISGGAFFALKGKQATRFVPHEFHGVHGTLETVAADENIVYFYCYDKRYFWIVNGP